MSYYNILLLFWVALIAIITTVTAPINATLVEYDRPQRQLISLGIDACACSPRYYEFTIHLSQNCEDDVTYGNGVLLTQCTIVPTNNSLSNSNTGSNNPIPSNITNNTANIDLQPITVTSINITELDQNLNVISKDSIYVPLSSGDIFSYTSVTNNYTIWNDTTDGDVNKLPRALQLTLVGINRQNVPIVFTGVIVYIDDCNIDLVCTISLLLVLFMSFRIYYLTCNRFANFASISRLSVLVGLCCCNVYRNSTNVVRVQI
jgi:hypothetical protein